MARTKGGRPSQGVGGVAAALVAVALPGRAACIDRGRGGSVGLTSAPTFINGHEGSCRHTCPLQPSLGPCPDGPKGRAPSAAGWGPLVPVVHCRTRTLRRTRSLARLPHLTPISKRRTRLLTLDVDAMAAVEIASTVRTWTERLRSGVPKRRRAPIQHGACRCRRRRNNAATDAPAPAPPNHHHRPTEAYTYFHSTRTLDTQRTIYKLTNTQHKLKTHLLP